MKKIPQRHCVGCRAERSKNELLRIVKTADGEISLDATGRKNGRGAYICRDAACLKKAMKNRALDKVFGISVPEELYAELEKEQAEVNGGG